MFMLYGGSGKFISLKFILLGLLLIVKPKYAGNYSVKYIYIILDPVDEIPETETRYNELIKDLKCPENLKPAYVPDRLRKVTVLGCFENKPIFNRNCPELNKGKLQENFYASCANFSPSCPSPYYVWESFKYPDCFRNSTGIEQEKNCYCTMNTINTWLLIMLIISLVCNACQIAPSVICIKMCLERRRNSDVLHSNIEIKNIKEDSREEKEEEDALDSLEDGSLHDEQSEALIQSLRQIVTQESLSVSVEIEN